MRVLDTFSLAGRVALVTGGAGLYGRQIVRALAEAGARVWTAARHVEPLQALAEELGREGLAVKAGSYDQADEASVLRLRDALLAAEGRIDALVNNAVARPMRRGWGDDVAAFGESMSVNATGLFVVTRAFGDAMAAAGHGSIVNIGSIQGMIGPDPTIYRGTEMSGWYPDYFFHKGGMINFTRFVASYYGRFGVRCNCVSPGGLRTEKHPEAFVRQYSDRTFLGRLAGETDLMGSIVFLASDASVYVTGTNLPVDGGYTAK